MFMIDLLRARGAEYIKVFAGGGGVITPQQIERAGSLWGLQNFFIPRWDEAGAAGHDQYHAPGV